MEYVAWHLTDIDNQAKFSDEMDSYHLTLRQPLAVHLPISPPDGLQDGNGSQENDNVLECARRRRRRDDLRVPRPHTSRRPVKSISYISVALQVFFLTTFA